MDPKGAVALVTGGAHRVGRGIVLALAGAGCDLFIHYGKSSEAALETAAEVKAMGRRVATGPADLVDPEAAAGLIEAASSALGPVSVLVNSASGFPEDTALDVTVGEWDRTMTVTLTSPVFLTQAFARALGDGDGVVINITDWRTERPYPDHFSYSVAKGGLIAFTKAAAVGLAPNVRVNALALGAILPPSGRGSDYLKELAGKLPLKRTGSPELVGQAVVELVRNDFMTGEVVRLDGGARLA